MVHACKASGGCQVFSSVALHCLGTGSQKLTVSARLAQQQTLRICLSLILTPNVGVKVKSSLTWLFTWVLGIRTQVFKFAQQMSPLPPQALSISLMVNLAVCYSLISLCPFHLHKNAVGWIFLCSLNGGF